MGREFDAEITGQVPDERVARTTVSGEVRQAGAVTFHRLDDTHTRVTLQPDHDPQGIADTVAGKRGFVRRQAEGDLKNFKQFIESRGTATGARRGTAWETPGRRNPEHGIRRQVDHTHNPSHPICPCLPGQG